MDWQRFWICLDPGNIIYYSDGRRLPTEGLARLAPAVNCIIFKDCVIEPGRWTCVVRLGVSVSLLIGVSHLASDARCGSRRLELRRTAPPHHPSAARRA